MPARNISDAHLLEVKALVKHFPITRGILLQHEIGRVRAVDGIDFFVRPGETLGLVGESGCGKSTTGRLVMRLIEATSGQITFAGQDVRALGPQSLRELRRHIQIIFQDPYASLNPRLEVRDIVGEALEAHHLAEGTAKVKRVQELLEVVGLSPEHLRRYPHEFSGGQRQRIGVARALATSPRLIVCDEPVSALDVSIQAQVVNLLQDLQHDFGLAYLFIAHDLAVVKHISDRVAVMYLGKILELADRDALYDRPLHPYTRALLSAIPIPDPTSKRERVILQGDVPSPVDPPSGCRFHTRCPEAEPHCAEEEPATVELAPGHHVACHHAQAHLEAGVVSRANEKQREGVRV